MERDPARYGKGKRWRLRYIGPDGKEDNESFERKADAENRKIQVEADLLKGTFIDPDAGKVTFQKFAEEVVENRTLDVSTRETMRSRLAGHVYPHIGGRELGQLAKRPSMIQALVRKLESAGLAPTYIETIMRHVGTVFAVAVADEVVAKNPVQSSAVVLPESTRKKIVPWTAGQVHGMREALPARFGAMVDAGAGLGLRQGEILGFSPDDVDQLHEVVTVQRQIKVLRGKLFFSAPKGNKTRQMPLPASVKRALDDHATTFPPVTVTLPWRSPDGEPHTARLYFSMPGNAYGGAIHKDRINESWHDALEEVGIVPPLQERLLIAAGASPEEAKQIIGIIESESRPRSLPAYVSRMPDSHVTAVLARIRSGEDVAALSIQQDLPPEALKRPRAESRGAAYREHGMHAMRHYFASLLLTEGENPKAVAEWLGHTDGGVLLLKTYAHLMPKSEQRMRTLVDRALERPADQDHGPLTARERGAGA
ncbi:tyrosine-type recombinase/integrase [Acrocarpospora phusangensis]|nr:hypothetical protein [Acrocarpospora phusangensis]